jgi:hypothetical protein
MSMLRELETVVKITNQLVHNFPRSLDVASLGYAVRQLARAAAAETTSTSGGKRKRKRDWAAIKRRQRARARAALAQAGAGNSGGEAALTPEQDCDGARSR